MTRDAAQLRQINASLGISGGPHNGKAKSKGIYGTATKNEIIELKDEGINAELIPWVEDKKN